MQSSGSTSASILRFGVFELDLVAGELRKNGILIKLQPQPFKVLALLASRSGQLLTRQDLQQAVWGSETFVDFENRLNSCIKQVRAVLGDDADIPRYVETLPRRGYRFLFPVEHVVPTATQTGDAAGHPPRKLRATPSPVTTIAAVAVAMMSLVGYFAWQQLGPGENKSAQRIRLAVLPFMNLNGDPEQDYLSDGLTEETIARLCRIQPSRLAVIGRTSVMAFKDSKKSLSEIGRILGVDYILEGSLRKQDSRVRITVRLIRATDQSSIWTDTFEQDVGDLLAVQSEVALGVSRRLALKLLPTEEARLSESPSLNPQAYDAYLRGRYFWSRRGEGLTKALKYFQEAIQAEPSYAAAYAGLADTYILMGNYLILPRAEAGREAKEAALKALKLDETLAMAYVSLGAIRGDYEFDFLGAGMEFSRAIELDPNYPTAHHWYGVHLLLQGATEEGIAEIKQALELDPLSLRINTDLGRGFYFAHHYDEAIEQYRKTLELEPNFSPAIGLLGLAYAQKGLYDEAIAELQRGIVNSGGGPSTWLAYTYGLAGKETEAQKILEELNRRRNVFGAGTLAIVHTGLKERERALTLLEEAYRERSGWLTLLKVDPIWDPLRSDPRFQDLLRRMNFTE